MSAPGLQCVGTTGHFYHRPFPGTEIASLQARTQGGCRGCPDNHLFVLKCLIWLNENIILFDISFIKGLVKGRLTNENNKRTIADAEIFDNRNGLQVGYDQALYPRPHDIFDYLCFFG